LTKRALGWPEDRTFYVPDEALSEFRKSIARGAELEAEWQHRVNDYRTAHSDTAQEFDRTLAGELPPGWQTKLPTFTSADGEMATRDAGGKAINALAAVVPNLLGGSGDLDPSTRTMMNGCGDFESPSVDQSGKGLPTQGTAGGVWSYAGRNVHFGLREHAMAAIIAGMALHGGLLPFGATFLCFSDYMRPAIRLAALSKARVIYVWTHDSIALGEDGPTHQPVEQLAGLRAMPNLMVIRPGRWRRRTASWWRSAMTSSSNSAQLRNRPTSQDRSAEMNASMPVTLVPPENLIRDDARVAYGNEAADGRVSDPAAACYPVAVHAASAA
jgi:transketolase